MLPLDFLAAWDRPEPAKCSRQLRGFYLTRLTLPSTSLFILAFVLLSEGLDVLWNVPDNTSWFLLLGIIARFCDIQSGGGRLFTIMMQMSGWVN
jgi:hypothetical protein